MSQNLRFDANRLVDKRDINSINMAQDAALKDVIYCTVNDYRRPDKLEVGDPLPALSLARLDAPGQVQLRAQTKRPLVLFFGSYT